MDKKNVQKRKVKKLFPNEKERKSPTYVGNPCDKEQ